MSIRSGIFALVVAAVVVLNSGVAHAVRGGSAAADGAYPFAARVTAGDRGCSGALVHAEYVLTLKSCFDPAPTATGAPPVATTVTVGRDDLSRIAGGVTVAVIELLPHPTLDAVLARLAAPVTGITPVAFGTAPVAGETLRATGYGRTGGEWVPLRLQTAPVTVGDVTAGGFTSTGSGVAICQGDAGGATLRETTSGVQLVGLHAGSYQQGCLESTSTTEGAAEVRADVLANWLRPYTSGAGQPVAERSPNLASGATVTVSSFIDQWGWQMARVVDGVRTGTAWTTWPPNSPPSEEWIALAWAGGAPRQVNRVDLYPRSDALAAVPTDIGVDVWENDAWKSVYRRAVAKTGGQPAKISFPAHTTTKIRVTGYSLESMQLAEIEAYESRNLAADATITTSSHIDQWGWVQANVNDGIRTGAAWTTWPPNSPVDDEWIELAFPGAPRQVNRVDLYPRSDVVTGVAARISVDVWENNAWKRVRTWAEPVIGGKPVRILFAGQTTSKIRVTGHAVESMQLAEIEAYDSANLAADATFTSSANLEEWGWSIAKVNDGERAGAGFSTWPPNSPLDDESIELAFPGAAERHVNRVELYPRSDVAAALPADLSVAVWDGSAWKTVLRRTAQLGAGQPARLTFPTQTTNKIKITAYGTEILQFAEVEAYLLYPLPAVPAPTDPLPSAVETGTYPGAAAILQQYSIRLLRGDGHIVFDSAKTFEESQCRTGLIQVEKSMNVEPYGMYYCFRTIGSKGFLTLEVPGTFGVRGGSEDLIVTAKLPNGTVLPPYEVEPNEPVAIEPGNGTELPQAILVELRLTA